MAAGGFFLTCKALVERAFAQSIKCSYYDDKNRLSGYILYHISECDTLFPNLANKDVMVIELTARQQELVALIGRHAPITGEQLAEMLGVSRPTLRSDLALLVMLGLVDAKPKVGYFPGSASAGGRLASQGLRARSEERRVGKECRL